MRIATRSRSRVRSLFISSFNPFYTLFCLFVEGNGRSNSRNPALALVKNNKKAKILLNQISCKAKTVKGLIAIKEAASDKSAQKKSVDTDPDEDEENEEGEDEENEEGEDEENEENEEEDPEGGGDDTEIEQRRNLPPVIPTPEVEGDDDVASIRSENGLQLVDETVDHDYVPSQDSVNTRADTGGTGRRRSNRRVRGETSKRGASVKGIEHDMAAIHFEEDPPPVKRVLRSHRTM